MFRSIVLRCGNVSTQMPKLPDGLRVLTFGRFLKGELK